MGNTKEQMSCSKCARAQIYYYKIKCGSTNEKANELFRLNGTKAAEKCELYKSLITTETAKIPLENALRFMLAGQAEFNMVSGKTGNKLYYKINRRETIVSNLSDKDNQYIYWLNGGKTPEDMEFLGTIYFNKENKTFNFSKGTRGKGNHSDVEVKSILFVLNKLYKKKYSLNVDVYHLGRCGKCGKRLTDIQSISTGIGLDCERLVGQVNL